MTATNEFTTIDNGHEIASGTHKPMNERTRFSFWSYEMGIKSHLEYSNIICVSTYQKKLNRCHKGFCLQFQWHWITNVIGFRLNGQTKPYMCNVKLD